MAEKPRVEYPGAIRHIIQRGNNKMRMETEDSEALKYQFAKISDSLDLLKKKS